jgi:hypothetical protein
MLGSDKYRTACRLHAFDRDIRSERIQRRNSFGYGKVPSTGWAIRPMPLGSDLLAKRANFLAPFQDRAPVRCRVAFANQCPLHLTHLEPERVLNVETRPVRAIDEYQRLEVDQKPE